MNELATIRRAYRYVTAYERRVLDAFEHVDAVAKGAGYSRNMPYRWQPLGRNLPSRDWAPEHSSWDFIPLYAARFQWLRGEPNKPGSRFLCVDHIADTAFEEWQRQHAGAPEPLEGLGAPESSRSVLRWLVVAVDASLPAGLWNEQWHALLPKHTKQPVQQFFPNEESVETLAHESKALRTRARCVDLANVEGLASLRARFLQPLAEALEALG